MKFVILKESPGSIFIRHRFTLHGKERQARAATNFSINPEFWDAKNECWDLSCKIGNPRRVEDKKHNSEIDEFNESLTELKSNIRNYLKTNPYPSSDDLRTEVLRFHNALPPEEEGQKKDVYPDDLIKFFALYLEIKSVTIPGEQKALSKSSAMRMRQAIERVSKYFGHVKISEIDDQFRRIYSTKMIGEEYSQSYIKKDLKIIKQICEYAERQIPINIEVKKWKFVNTEGRSVSYPTFNLQEIETLHNTPMPHDYLDNARDWLIISCFLGQRVGDFLKMDAKNIIDGEFYVVEQQKGQKDVTIWLLPMVRKILKKRGGQFPRRISESKYNLYIKEVCKLCGFDELMYGGVIKVTENGPRKVYGDFPKYELVTSHIGRRSFVTIFKSTMGNDITKSQTGHADNSMLELYDQTAGIEAAKRFKNIFYQNFNDSSSSIAKEGELVK